MHVFFPFFESDLNSEFSWNSHSSDGIYELRLILCKMGAPCSRISQKRPHSYPDVVTKLFAVAINGLHTSRLLRHWDIYLACGPVHGMACTSPLPHSFSPPQDPLYIQYTISLFYKDTCTKCKHAYVIK
jgi:hypothetical protein